VQTHNMQTIGWREWVSLPGFGAVVTKAKIDTGARTSALHAYYVEPFKRNGKEWVRFGLHPWQGDTDTAVDCEARVVDRRQVTDSGGHREMRYVIATSVQLGADRFDAEITLTDRENMRFRMLLGRTALRARFLVDSDRSFLLGGDKDRPPSLV
jgi:hypothetical protein